MTSGSTNPNLKKNYAHSSIINYIPDEINQNTPIWQALRHTFMLQLQMILTYAPIAIDGTDPEGVHKVRVGLRRLRTALKLFKPFLQESEYKFLNTYAKTTANELGTVRDLDVLKIHFFTYCLNTKQTVDPQSEWPPIFQTHYDQIRRKMVEHLESESFNNLIARTYKICQDTKYHLQNPEILSQTLKDFLPSSLEKQLTKIQSYQGQLSLQTDYAAFHALRLKFKSFRYTIEFFPETFSTQSIDKIVNLLIKIQDHLGELNDAHIAGVILSELQKNSPAWSDCLKNYQAYRGEEFTNLKKNFLPIWKKFNKKDITEIIAQNFSNTPHLI